MCHYVSLTISLQGMEENGKMILEEPHCKFHNLQFKMPRVFHERRTFNNQNIFLFKIDKNLIFSQGKKKIHVP